MKLNEAVSKRISQLLTERGMNQYQLFSKSGIPNSTINNLIKCAYDSVKLRIIHEICQGFEISISDFFSPRYLMKSTLTHSIKGGVLGLLLFIILISIQHETDPEKTANSYVVAQQSDDR